MNRELLRAMIRGSYDIQKLRIQIGNRIVANFKASLGQNPSEDENTLDAEGKMILKDIRTHYKKITDGVKTFPRKKTFKATELISSYTELCLVAQYCELEKQEDTLFYRLKYVLEDFPIYNGFLINVKGVGNAMAGVIISEIDITKATYPSSLWAYAGLDVSQGTGRSRKAEHLREYEYIAKDGEVKKKKGITFNPFLKTKLIGVLGSSFLRAGENKYSAIYYDYKNRLENSDKHKEKTKGHRHNMAIRYMVKQFLMDLHLEWRKLEGLSISKSYHEEKLGHKHAA